MDKQIGKRAESELKGVGYGILAYTVWGLLPLYWKLLDIIPAGEILAHRIFWSFIFVAILVICSGNWESLKILLQTKNKKNFFLIFLCAIIISINWFTYIWAVNSNRIVEASMGYYINPLLVVLLGTTVLKEKLNIFQWIAIILASIGVLIITIQYGQIPWIALTLAISFALYGLFKKIINIDAINSLALETTIIMPLALAFIILKQLQGNGALGVVSFGTVLILIGSGIATATPLLWFSKAAQQIKLSTIGFLQYLAPTISLLLGIFIFKEDFSSTHILSFSFIWIALIIYSFSNINFKRDALPVYTKNR